MQPDTTIFGRRRLVFAALLVFLVSFVFFDSLLQGLPFHYGEDTDMLQLALQTPPTTLLALSLNPLSRHLYQFGEKTFLTTRPFETLVFKAIGSLYGFRAGPLYRVKSFSAALISLGLFLMLFRATSSLSISLLGWLFFLTAPAFYASARYIHDYEILSQCFLLGAFWCFWRGGDPRIPRNKAILFVLASLLLGTLALKTKETAKILPLVLFLYLVLQQGGNPFKELATGRGRLRIFTVLFFSLAVLSPLLANSEGTLRPLALNPRNLYSFLVQNSSGYEAERHVALFTLENTMPGSFLGTFGFLLGWGLVLTFLFALFKPKGVGDRLSSLPSSPPDPTRSLLKLCLAWWISALIGYLLIQRLDDRFLAVSLAPAVIVVFTALYSALARIKARSHSLHVIVKSSLALLLLINAQRNLDHVIFARNFHGGWLVAEDRIFHAVTEDLFSGQTPSDSQIDQFLKHEIAQEVLAELRPPNGLERKVNWDALEKSGQRLPYLYVATLEPTPSRHPDWKLLTAVSTLSEGLYGRFIQKVKRKSSKTVYLYKWESNKRL